MIKKSVAAIKSFKEKEPDEEATGYKLPGIINQEAKIGR